MDIVFIISRCYLEYKRGDEHMQNTQFRELEEQEIFVIQGGEYDRINSCFNSILKFIHGNFS